LARVREIEIESITVGPDLDHPSVGLTEISDSFEIVPDGFNEFRANPLSEYDFVVHLAKAVNLSEKSVVEDSLVKVLGISVYPNRQNYDSDSKYPAYS
jgi:hypothetical protein